MNHRPILLKELEKRISFLLSRQITDPSDPRLGGFRTDSFHVEPRQSGFHLGEMTAAFVTPDCAWYLSPRLKDAIELVLGYMFRHQRPDGCFDLSSCNFASPPDTAFMMNAVLSGW